MQQEEEVRERLAKRLAETGTKKIEASARAGLDRNYVADFLAGRKKSINATALYRIANALQCDMEYFFRTTKIETPPRTDEKIPLLYAAAPGMWLESLDTMSKSLKADEVNHNILYDPAYEGRQQFAARIEDESLDLLFPPGSFAHCIERVSSDPDPADGEVFLIKRIKGPLMELSIKAYRKTGGEIYLATLSSNPSFGRMYVETKKTDAEMVGEFEIVAQVIGYYHALQRKAQTLDLG
jgi:transcriptional regulator with XRE-family HTH domain